MANNPFVDAFVRAASEVLRDIPKEAYSWAGNAEQPPACLTIKASPGGFPVELQCETYGVYPKALGWHGPPWDVTVYLPEAMAETAKEFLRSVLSPKSSLEVHRSNGKPYKHVLRYVFDEELVADVEATRCYNWFGDKTVEIARNTWLPAQ